MTAISPSIRSDPSSRHPCPPMVDPRGAVHELAHRHARQHGPQRRVADAGSRPRRLGIGAAVARRRLLARVRRPLVHDELARRAIRAQRHHATRPRTIRRGLDLRRPHRQHLGTTDRVASRDGCSRRDDHARDPVDPHQRLPPRRAGQGRRDLVGRRRRWRRDRHVAVGLPARALRLGLRIPRRRSVRRGFDRGGGAPRTNVARPRPRQHRRAGRGAVDGRSRHARLRPHRSARRTDGDRPKRSVWSRSASRCSPPSHGGSAAPRSRCSTSVCSASRPSVCRPLR